MTGRTVLVTGGIRSGKSAHAEARFADRPATYVATGPTRDDDAWAERVRRHRARRPASWSTLETTDVAAALATLATRCLVDDLGTWTSTALEACGAWSRDGDDAAPGWHERFTARVDALCSAVRRFEHDLVLVSSEVGFGLVSPYASGRVFTDELGTLNQRIAAECDEVVLVVSGCPLVIADRTSREDGRS